MAVTRACILAAGVGDRLGGAGDKPPKALLEFGGRSLLARHLDILAAAGVDDVAIGVGYKAEDIAAAAQAAGFPGRLRFIDNPDFREGSVITLAVLGAAMREPEDAVLMMDADVLYPPDLMGRLIASAHANCLLIDRDFEDGVEPVKICIRGEAEIVEFRKAVDRSYDWCGESVGFFKFSAEKAAELAGRAAAYVAAGRRDQPYEEVVRDAILANPGDFGFEDITGMPWIEIDFPEDVARASAEILPLIH